MLSTNAPLENDPLIDLVKEALAPTPRGEDYWYAEKARKIPAAYDPLASDDEKAKAGFPDYWRDSTPLVVPVGNDEHVIGVTKRELKYVSQWKYEGHVRGGDQYVRLVDASQFLEREDAVRDSYYGVMPTSNLRDALKDVIREELKGMGIVGNIKVEARYTGEMHPEDILPDYHVPLSNAPKQMLEIQVVAQELGAAMERAGWIGV